MYIQLGYEQCKADPCVFRKIVDGVVVAIVGVYVDDVIIGGLPSEVDALHENLNKRFTTKHLGACTYYDGCAIVQDELKGTTTVTQEAYTNSLLARLGIKGTKPTPASPSSDLGPKRDDEQVTDEPVREVLGSLLWLSTMTRVDIANAVRAVARHAHAPTDRHWRAVVHILKYLNGTRGYGLTFVRGSGLRPIVYTDASYADEVVDRRSVSGVAVVLGGATVTHASKGQKITATSSTEAEYISAAEGLKDGLFVHSILAFVAPETQTESILVRDDNEGAIALIQNPMSSARTKHIDVRFHFIRSLFRKGVLTVEFVPTEVQHADVLTKALSETAFASHRNALMNIKE